jgi:hypothetical protein
MAVTITRTALVDDDGTGTTGTVVNNAVKTELYDQIDAALASVGNPANLTASVPVNKGGTGAATLTAHGVVIGNGTSAVNVTGAGTAGQVLTSNGASADPTFQANGALPVPRTETGTGNITALALPSGSGDLVIYMNNASLATIQGIAAGAAAQRLTIHSIGAGQVDLSHQDTAATAATRLINFATSGKSTGTGTVSASLAAGVGVAELEYDAANSRWRLVAHEQGAWITATYAAGNFTANGSMTWTVDSGDVTTLAYYLRGRTLHVSWFIATTTIGGTVNTQLIISNAAYGGFTWVKTLLNTCLTADNGASIAATTSTALFQISSAGATLVVFKQGGATFTLGTNNCQTSGELFAEVN